MPGLQNPSVREFTTGRRIPKIIGIAPGPESETNLTGKNRGGVTVRNLSTGIQLTAAQQSIDTLLLRRPRSP